MGIIIGPLFLIYLATAITCLLVLFEGTRNSVIGIREWSSAIALMLAILGGAFAIWKLSIASLWFADAFWLNFAVLPIVQLSITGIVLRFQDSPSLSFRFNAVVILFAVSISPFVIYWLAAKQPGFSLH